MLTGHFAAGLALKSYNKSIPLWVLFAGLLIIPPAIGPLLPTPKSVHEVAISGLFMYAFFTAAAFKVDRLK